MTKPLDQANEGDVFRHEITGAIVVVVENRGRWIDPRSDDGWRCDELVTVQLTDGTEGHDLGWVSILEPSATGWHYVRTAG